MNAAKRILLAALSGGLLILCFPFPDQGWLAYIALIPFLLVVYEAGPGASFMAGWLTGTVFFAGLCYWVGIYGAVPLGLMAIGIGALGGVAGAAISYVSSSLKRITPHRFIWLLRPPAVAAVWTALEIIRSETGVYSFPYGTVGLSQHGFGPAIVLASIFGVYGISFLVVMINAFLVETWLARLEGKGKRAIAAIATGAALLIFILAAGAWLQTGVSANAGATYKIAIVQASIPQNEKWLVSERAATMARYERLVRQAAKERPDLIVLPEAALPAYVSPDDPLYQELAGWAGLTRVPILAGVPLLKGQEPFNSVVLFDARGKQAGKYEKMVPALFGELVPFRPISERIYPLFGRIADIRRGAKQTVFTLKPAGKPPLKFGVLICSESLYSRLGRQIGAGGAESLFVLTNDAWFYATNEAALHYDMSAFRAAETGFWLTQAANTGISGFMDPAGKSVKRTEINEIAVIESTVQAKPGRTFYSSWGWFFPIALVITCALMIPCFCLVNNCTSGK
ncbi:MAG: apolipoprotein N-acyltransferase [Actinomycetota bacterium]